MQLLKLDYFKLHFFLGGLRLAKTVADGGPSDRSCGESCGTRRHGRSGSKTRGSGPWPPPPPRPPPPPSRVRPPRGPGGSPPGPRQPPWSPFGRDLLDMTYSPMVVVELGLRELDCGLLRHLRE